jgi:hypothetical protein
LWHPVEGVATSLREEVTGRLAGDCGNSGAGPCIAAIADGEIIIVYSVHDPTGSSNVGFVESAVRTTTGEWQLQTVVAKAGSIQDTPAVAFDPVSGIHVVYRSDEDGCDMCDEKFLNDPMNLPIDIPIEEIFYMHGTRGAGTISWDPDVRVSDSTDVNSRFECPLQYEVASEEPTLTVDGSGNVWVVWKNKTDRVSTFHDRAGNETSVASELSAGGFCDCDDIYEFFPEAPANAGCCAGGREGDEGEIWGRVKLAATGQWSDFLRISATLNDYVYSCFDPAGHNDPMCEGLTCPTIPIYSVVSARPRVIPGPGSTMYFGFRTDPYSLDYLAPVGSGFRAFQEYAGTGFCDVGTGCSFCVKYPDGRYDPTTTCLVTGPACTGNHIDLNAFKMGVWDDQDQELDWWGQEGLFDGTDVRVAWRNVDQEEHPNCQLNSNVPPSYLFNDLLPDRTFNAGAARLARTGGSPGNVWTIWGDGTPYEFPGLTKRKRLLPSRRFFRQRGAERRERDVGRDGVSGWGFHRGSGRHSHDQRRDHGLRADAGGHYEQPSHPNRRSRQRLGERHAR